MAILQMTREQYEVMYGKKAPGSPTVNVPSATTASVLGTAGQAEGGNFMTGLGKSFASTIKSAGQIGEGVGRALTPKPLEKYLVPPSAWSEEALQKKAQTGTGFEQRLSQKLTAEEMETKPGEGLGRFVGDVAQYAIPQTKVAGLTKGLPKLAQIGARMATGAGVVGLQTQNPVAAGTVAGLEAAIPIAGRVILKPTAALIGRLFRGIGTGLSGMSEGQIGALLKDPKAAKGMVEWIRKAGGSRVLQREAEMIIGGVKSIETEGKSMFGRALETLGDVKIPISNIKTNVGAAWKNAKISFGKNGVSLKGVDFADDKLAVSRANEIVNYINKLKDLSGKGLRDAMDFVESKMFKGTTSDAKNYFNTFARDTLNALRDSVKGVSPVLEEANAKYAQMKGFSDAIQAIFGKVKFKSLPEVRNIASKLDSLFKKGEFDQDLIDQFFTKIGVKPEVFRAGEAARQAGNMAIKTNPVGLNFFEIVRNFTSGLVPPKTVRDIAINFGIGENLVKEWATKLSVESRSALIRLLIGDQGQNPNNK